MITNEQIRQAIEDCNEKGYPVRVRDISYILLCDKIEDRSAVYKMVFGMDEDFNIDKAEDFDKSDSIINLRKYILSNFYNDLDISFEENKREMVRLIETAKLAMDEGWMKAGESLKLQTELRVKLNDKFKVSDENQEQMIVVNTKFNSICEHCGHEISVPTKEYLMEKYNLVEKEN